MGAQGVRLQQIDLQIALIERFCEDLSDLLDELLSDTDQDSGIAIFNQQGFVWMSNHHNPIHALEEFDQEVGIGSFGEGLDLIPKIYTFFEVPKKDLPLWRDASVEDHPDTEGLRSISL